MCEENQQIYTIWRAGSARWISKMYTQSSKCLSLAKRWLLWYVYCSCFSIDRSWLWCLLRLWNCTKINNNEKLGFNVMSFPSLTSSKFNSKSRSWIKKRKIIIFNTKKNYIKFIWKEFNGTIKIRKRRISKKSLNNWWWWTRWDKPRSLFRKKSSLLGIIKERQNGCYWR
jgi:hypothetical protein